MPRCSRRRGTPDLISGNIRNARSDVGRVLNPPYAHLQRCDLIKTAEWCRWRRSDEHSIGFPETEALRGVRGTILLVGAGKMGSALLEGWLALGVEPGALAVIEPQPSSDVTALAGRGLALNPPQHLDHAIAALVIAVKPQVAPA